MARFLGSWLVDHVDGDEATATFWSFQIQKPASSGCSVQHQSLIRFNLNSEQTKNGITFSRKLNVFNSVRFLIHWAKTETNVYSFKLVHQETHSCERKRGEKQLQLRHFHLKRNTKGGFGEKVGDVRSLSHDEPVIAWSLSMFADTTELMMRIMMMTMIMMMTLRTKSLQVAYYSTVALEFQLMVQNLQTELKYLR